MLIILQYVYMPGHAQTHDQLIQQDLSFLLLTELQCVLHLQLSILALLQQLIDLQLRPHQHLGRKPDEANRVGDH